MWPYLIGTASPVLSLAILPSWISLSSAFIETLTAPEATVSQLILDF